MSTYAKCLGMGCPKTKQCARYIAKLSPGQVAASTYWLGGGCDVYIAGRDVFQHKGRKRSAVLEIAGKKVEPMDPEEFNISTFPIDSFAPDVKSLIIEINNRKWEIPVKDLAQYEVKKEKPNGKS